MICLSAGAVLNAAIAPHEGKDSGELGLLRGPLDTLRATDVLLADSCYCNYVTVASLQATGMNVLFGQHGARITDFQRGQTLDSSREATAASRHEAD